jgi:hypothetical protein
MAAEKRSCTSSTASIAGWQRNAQQVLRRADYMYMQIEHMPV